MNITRQWTTRDENYGCRAVCHYLVSLEIRLEDKREQVILANGLEKIEKCSNETLVDMRDLCVYENCCEFFHKILAVVNAIETKTLRLICITCNSSKYPVIIHYLHSRADKNDIFINPIDIMRFPCLVIRYHSGGPRSLCVRGNRRWPKDQDQVTKTAMRYF